MLLRTSFANGVFCSVCSLPVCWPSAAAVPGKPNERAAGRFAACTVLVVTALFLFCGVGLGFQSVLECCA